MIKFIFTYKEREPMKKQKSKWKIVAGIILICQLMVSIIAGGILVWLNMLPTKYTLLVVLILVWLLTIVYYFFYSKVKKKKGKKLTAKKKKQKLTDTNLPTPRSQNTRL